MYYPLVEYSGIVPFVDVTRNIWTFLSSDTLQALDFKGQFHSLGLDQVPVCLNMET